MNLALISDVHLVFDNPVARQDNLIETQFDKLAFVFETAKRYNAPIVQAGDLCDKPRSWGLLPVLIEFWKRHGVDYYAVYGQHDTYMYSEETRDRTNIGILAKAGLITLLRPDCPAILGGGKVQIFGANFGQKLGKVMRNGFTLGVIHASISDRAMYPGHVFSKPSDFIEENSSYDFILCGDIHRMFYMDMPQSFNVEGKAGRRILNTGPLLRLEATEYNFIHRPGLAILNTDNGELEWIDIPCVPAEDILSRAHIEKKIAAQNLLDEFVGSMKEAHPEMEDVGDGVSFVENLWEFIRNNNIDQGVIDLLAEIITDLQAKIGEKNGKDR